MDIYKKRAIVASSMEHVVERDCYFKAAQINWPKQNKHIPSEKNFLPDRDDRGKTPHWIGGEHIHVGPKHIPVHN